MCRYGVGIYLVSFDCFPRLLSFDLNKRNLQLFLQVSGEAKLLGFPLEHESREDVTFTILVFIYTRNNAFSFRSLTGAMKQLITLAQGSVISETSADIFRSIQTRICSYILNVAQILFILSRFFRKKLPICNVLQTQLQECVRVAFCSSVRACYVYL